ncbi:hypothetical protein SBRCBS47491_005683 [Sporothrix bragantina]|uniref:Uncharacterized protein n=1 Tax=Sporothrix bragantina TaxID=671064 RepID=A0ABP0BYL9_9PEZI
MATLMEPAPSVPLVENLTEKLCSTLTTPVSSASASLITSPMPSPSTISPQDDENSKQRDSAICIDENEFCGILEHATVEDEWEGNSGACASLNTSSLCLVSSTDTHDENQTTCLVTAPPRSFSAPPDVLLATATTSDDAHDAHTAYNYDAVAYETGGWTTAADAHSAFPHVFGIFDYGDGETFYLGGGGARITRHLSERQTNPCGDNGRRMAATAAGVHRFWPFQHPPLYTCRLHARSTGSPAVVLYSGLDPSRDSAWADVQFLSKTSFKTKSLASLAFGGITIGIPPLTEGLPMTVAGRKLIGRAEEKLSVHLGWHRRYRFEVEVADMSKSGARGDKNLLRREAFEWRYCSGAELEALEEREEADTDSSGSFSVDEIVQPLSSRLRLGLTDIHGKVTNTARKSSHLLKRALSRRQKKFQDTPSEKQETLFSSSSTRGSQVTINSRWKSGWQLVRLTDASNPLSDVLAAPLLDHLIGEEAGRAAARRRTPDGHEIVAIWSNADPSNTTREASRFTRLGSGTTGELGERWALMAVASGLAVWEHGRRARRRRESTVVQACGGLASIMA